MSDAPKRIWAYHNRNHRTYLLSQGKFHNVQYLRADIAERQIAELRAERDLAVAEREFWRVADRNSVERAEAAEADNVRLSEALQKIASCTRYHPDDVAAIARAVLSGSGAAAPTGEAPMTDTTLEQRLRGNAKALSETGILGQRPALLEAADRIEADAAEIARLSAELAEARKALSFYADTSKYPAPSPAAMRALWYDCGQIARHALASKEPSHAA